MYALKELPTSNAGFKKPVDVGKAVTTFMKKGASDVLLHQTRILLRALSITYNVLHALAQSAWSGIPASFD